MGSTQIGLGETPQGSEVWLVSVLLSLCVEESKKEVAFKEISDALSGIAA